MSNDMYGGTANGSPIFAANHSAGMRVNIPVASRGEIDSAMEALGQEIEMLAKVAAELDSRLSAVVRPYPRPGEATECAAATYQCALACSIDNRIGYIKTNRERLEAILSALQL